MLGLAACTATAAIGFTATPALALNPTSYSQLKNADSHQYCLDIKSEDPAEGARAQLWNCTGVAEQQFILVAANLGEGPIPGQWTIRSKSAGKCLWVSGNLGARITQKDCIFYAQAQSWDLRSTGEIVSIFDGRCLDTAQDAKGAAVMEWQCNGNIAQRWFF
jgi:alpha-galactosidase